MCKTAARSSQVTSNSTSSSPARAIIDGLTLKIRARDSLWAIIYAQYHQSDAKLRGADPEWRIQYSMAVDHLLDFSLGKVSRPIRETVKLFRSHHLYQANMNSNPARVAIAMQTVAQQGLLSQQHVDFLVQTNLHGLQLEECRDFSAA